VSRSQRSINANWRRFQGQKFPRLDWDGDDQPGTRRVGFTLYSPSHPLLKLTTDTKPSAQLVNNSVAAMLRLFNLWRTCSACSTIEPRPVRRGKPRAGGREREVHVHIVIFDFLCSWSGRGGEEYSATRERSWGGGAVRGRLLGSQGLYRYSSTCRYLLIIFLMLLHYRSLRHHTISFNIGKSVFCE
jgi:hypothetical protein